MTDREKKELIEAEETILQLFFDAYERAMKYTKRKSQEGGKNQWQKRIKASVCFLKWDAERR